MDGDSLAIASTQMQKSIENIDKAVEKDDFDLVEKHLDSIFALLIVRVISANRLPNMDGGTFFNTGDLTDAYVLIRLGKVKRRHCPSTRVIQDNLNPRWEEEFCLEVPSDVKYFSLEVFDSDEDQWVGAPREGIGHLPVKFRHCPGQWIDKVEPLLSFNNNKPIKSKLHFQFFYVNSVADLGKLREAEEDTECAQGVPSVQSVGTFLASAASTVGGTTFASTASPSS